MTVRTPLGQVLRDEDGMRLEFRRSYDEPVEQVWSALTEPDRVAPACCSSSGSPSRTTPAASVRAGTTTWTYLDRFGAALRGAAVPDDFDAYFPALQDRYAAPAPRG